MYVIGGSICGAFAFFGVLSVICYKPWRRWIERKRIRKSLERRDGDGNEAEDRVIGRNNTAEGDLDIASSNEGFLQGSPNNNVDVMTK